MWWEGEREITEREGKAGGGSTGEAGGESTGESGVESTGESGGESTGESGGELTAEMENRAGNVPVRHAWAAVPR